MKAEADRTFTLHRRLAQLRKEVPQLRGVAALVHELLDGLRTRARTRVRFSTRVVRRALTRSMPSASARLCSDGRRKSA